MAATGHHESLIAALRAVAGDQHVLVEPAAIERFATDWTGRHHGEPLAVVRPADTGETAAVLRACRAANVAVVPQGGHTGLVGGGAPRGGDVVLSLTRLDQLGAVNPVGGHVVAGAGVTLDALQRHARDGGLEFPVDLGARASATVGGMIASNAGGTRVLRHGTMRAQILGLEAVLADGAVIDRMAPLVKDNGGYHLPSLLAGSEGTLAVITRACLRLVAPANERLTVLVGLGDTDAASALVGRLLRTVPELDAAEVFYADGLELVQRHLGVSPPFAAPVYLLLEAAGRDDLADAMLAAIGSDVLGSAAAVDAAGREALWRLREGHIEAIAREGRPERFDVAVPLDRAGRLVAGVRAIVAQVAPEARCVLYGHLGDGNIHVNVVGAEDRLDALHEAVFGLVLELSGSVAAEHGVGIEKVHTLQLARGPADVAVMAALKRAFDPTGILNPGVIVPRSPPRLDRPA